MDLISHYWKNIMPPEDQEKCAKIPAKVLYQPTRMAQGLFNAPATFQRMMDKILLTMSYPASWSIYPISICSPDTYGPSKPFRESIQESDFRKFEDQGR